MSERQRVGRYELLGKLGQGGMAVVHLARQTDLDRLVAVKELNALHASDPRAAQRFLQEARVAGSFSHPNIVTVFDYIEHRGTPFIAMEYLERGSLRPWIGELTLEQIGGVLGDVLGGLIHAERRNVVHRDLKPENLLLTLDGQVKIADFGIAKATSRTTTSFQTATGIAVGTPGYMAPEQAMARGLGPWTDLYAVGCMAYELLTGRPPFAETTDPIALLLRHVNDLVEPAAEVGPDVDADVSRWVDALLVKEPERRPQSAADAWESLDEILIAKLGPRWRRAAPILAEARGAGITSHPAPVPSRAGGRTAPAPGTDEVAPGPPRIGGPYTPPPDDLYRAPPLDPDAVPEYVSFELPPPSRPPATSTPPHLAPTPPSPAVPRLATTMAPRPGASQAPSRPERARRRAGVLVVAVLVVVAVGALVLTRRDHEPASRERPAQASAGARLTAGPLRGRLPAGWSRVSGITPIPGLHLSPAASGASTRSDAEAVLLGVASSDADTPALLAPGFLRAVAPSGGLPAGRPVTIGGGALSALRYDRLAPAGYGRFLTVFAIPTSAGVATLACSAPAGGDRAFAARCDDVAASLSVRGARTFDVGASRSYATAVNAIIRKLDRTAAAGLRRMRSPRTAKAQGAAADAISRAYRTAARSQAEADVSPADRGANRRVARALGGVALRYRGLAEAAAHNRGERYRSAARRVAGARSDVNSSLDALAPNGYARLVRARLRTRAVPAMKRPRSAAARQPTGPAQTAPPGPAATPTPGPAPTSQATPAPPSRSGPAPTPRLTPIPARPTPIAGGDG